MPLRSDALDKLGGALAEQRCWVVAGQEPLLVEECADALRSHLRGRGFDGREVFRVDGTFSWGELFGECSNASLFAEQRLIELRMESGLDAKSAEALCELAEQAAGDIAILVIDNSLEPRSHKTQWFRKLDAGLSLIYIWRLRSDEYGGWIRKRLQRLGLQGDAAVVEGIRQCSEGNLLAGAQLLRQLQALHADGGTPLKVEDVLALGADMARFDPFSLMERVYSGDAAAALRAVRRLRRGGAELPAITGGLAFSLRQWLGAQQAYARSGDAVAAARSVGVFPPRAQILARAVGRSRPGQIQGLLRWLADIDGAAKRGEASAAWDDLLTWTTVASGALRADFLPRALCPSLP